MRGKRMFGVLVSVALMGVGGVSQDQAAKQTVGELLPVARALHSPIKLQIGLPVFMEAGDFDEDGNVDLILVTWTPVEELAELIWKAKVVLLSGDGRGGYDAPKQLYEVEHSQGSLGGLAVGDLDLDGDLDFAITDMANGGIWVFWGNGAGEFAKELLRPRVGLTFSRVLSVDFDGDMHPDLLATEVVSRSIYVLWGGENNFERVSVYSFDIGYIPILLATGDFDENGFTDVAVMGWRWTEKAEVVYFVAVLSTAGTKALKLLSINDVGEPALPGTAVLAVGDYDGDGHLDILTIRSGLTFVLWGKGDGTFMVRDLYPVFDPIVVQLVLADIDGDGCLNEILLGMSTERVWVSTGCYGSAGHILPILLQGSPRVGVVTDVNNDGVLDLVIATSMWPNWTYLELLLGRKVG